eukprot:6257594-Alexandrium_andersonii.AAC.1
MFRREQHCEGAWGHVACGGGGRRARGRSLDAAQVLQHGHSFADAHGCAQHDEPLRQQATGRAILCGGRNQQVVKWAFAGKAQVPPPPTVP